MIEYTVSVFNNRTEWYLDGKRHRADGPAIEHADGSKEWYNDGLLHREGGPAVEFADGSTFWCLNGLRHRTDGPAVEWDDGSKEWYLNGEELTEAQWNEAMNPVKEMTMAEICKAMGCNVKVIK